MKPATKPRPQTPRRGADDDRSRIKRHILSRNCVKTIIDGHAYIRMANLIDWIDTISNRARDKKGGL